MLLEVLHVARHLRFHLPLDNEWKEQFPDAVSVQIDRDRDAGACPVVEWFDPAVDVPSHWAVESADRPVFGGVRSTNSDVMVISRFPTRRVSCALVPT